MGKHAWVKYLWDCMSFKDNMDKKFWMLFNPKEILRIKYLWVPRFHQDTRKITTQITGCCFFTEAVLWQERRLWHKYVILHYHENLVRKGTGSWAKQFPISQISKICFEYNYNSWIFMCHWIREKFLHFSFYRYEVFQYTYYRCCCYCYRSFNNTKHSRVLLCQELY